MKIPHVLTALVLLALPAAAQTAPSTAPPSPAPPSPAPAAPPAELTPPQLQAAQREAMKKLSWMDGIWRGPATAISEGGKKLELIHTERVGSMLDGTVKVIEGRSYTPDGQAGGFNAFAIISYDARAQKYEFRSYSTGNAGTFEIIPTQSGYSWTVPAGPNQSVKYTASFKDGIWAEKGEFLAANQPAVPIFEMNLKRVSDTDWPLTTPVGPK